MRQVNLFAGLLITALVSFKCLHGMLESTKEI
jgi:hypothetical protein